MDVCGRGLHLLVERTECRVATYDVCNAWFLSCVSCPKLQQLCLIPSGVVPLVPGLLLHSLWIESAQCLLACMCQGGLWLPSMFSELIGWNDDYALCHENYDGAGSGFPWLRGWSSKFFSLLMIDDATGCFLFLVLQRNWVLSRHWMKMMRGLMIAFCLFGATWSTMTLHLIACYDGKGPCFPLLRGWGSEFFPLQIIDHATGCLLFLVLCRKGMLVGTGALLLQLFLRKPSLTCMREKNILWAVAQNCQYLDCWLYCDVKHRKNSWYSYWGLLVCEAAHPPPLP